jgi:hypothetical protein
MTYEEIMKAALEIHRDALQEMMDDDSLQDQRETWDQLWKVEQLLEPTTRILPLFG